MLERIRERHLEMSCVTHTFTFNTYTHTKSVCTHNIHTHAAATLKCSNVFASDTRKSLASRIHLRSTHAHNIGVYLQHTHTRRSYAEMLERIRERHPEITRISHADKPNDTSKAW